MDTTSMAVHKIRLWGSRWVFETRDRHSSFRVVIAQVRGPGANKWPPLVSHRNPVRRAPTTSTDSCDHRC